MCTMAVFASEEAGLSGSDPGSESDYQVLLLFHF